MSQQKDLLREIAAATSQGGASDRISDWFTEDFGCTSRASPLCRLDMRGQAKCGHF